MASPFAALGVALAALLFFTAIGSPIARRLFSDRSLAAGFAPTIGWATFTAAALPILCVVGFGPVQIAFLGATALAGGAVLRLRESAGPVPDAVVPPFAYLVAGLLAAAPAAALLPTYVGDGVLLAPPIFDHSKVAIVDEIARNGLPPLNPFYAEAGAPDGLVYYYLWHACAAMLSLLPGVSGWEADVGLTGFTAFATFSVVMALAASIARRSSAAYWALALCMTASARPLVSLLFGSDVFGTWLSDYPDLGAAIVQIAWAPQHVASAGCVVIALLLVRNLSDADVQFAPAGLGLLAAAAFGSSVWVGGGTFAVAAATVGAYALAKSQHRGRLIARGFLTAAIALAAVFPILVEQARAMAMRAGGAPIALHPYEVFGPAFADWIRRPLDLVGFWFIQLPVDLPAIFPIGVFAVAAALRTRAAHQDEERRVRTLAIGAAASFAIAWLLVSTILNNDLGWRAILPGTLILTAFAGAALSRWTRRPRRLAVLLPASACILAGAYGGVVFLREDIAGQPASAAEAFARSPDLWRDVQAVSEPTERIANNPVAFAFVTKWPINISWALFANRRSCYAGWEFARPFSGQSAAKVDLVDGDFRAAFSGALPAANVRELFRRHNCRLAIVTVADGAWKADAFARDPSFDLVGEHRDAWRIYRLRDAEPSP
jgi:hypothetical protein